MLHYSTKDEEVSFHYFTSERAANFQENVMQSKQAAIAIAINKDHEKENPNLLLLKERKKEVKSDSFTSEISKSMAG